MESDRLDSGDVWGDDEKLISVKDIENYISELKKFKEDEEERQSLSVNDIRALAVEIEHWDSYVKLFNRMKKD